VIGDDANIEPYSHILETCGVVIDAAGLRNSNFFNAVVELQQKRNPNNDKWLRPIYIFTSGVLIYGNNPQTNVVDTTWVTLALPERSQHERNVASSDRVRGVVIRPGFVYGGSGGFFGPELFEVKEELIIYGSEEKRWSWVHHEDLAEAYVLVCNSGSNVDGEVFDISGTTSPTYGEVKRACAKLVGWKGTVKHEQNNPMFEVSVITNCQKAYNLLGWREKHLGFLEELDKYYRSYKAQKSLSE